MLDIIYYPLLYLFLCTSAAISTPNSFEFCADNQLFSFSYKACPGGILLKKPMELTEPCHCINQHLTVYSSCNYKEGTKQNTTYPAKVCRRYDRFFGKRDRVLVRLLQPASTGRKYRRARLRHKDSKCRRIRDKCTRSPSNIQLKSIINKETNVKALYHNDSHESHIVEHFKHRRNHRGRHRLKRDISISKIQDDKLRERVQETMDLLNELQFGSSNLEFAKPIAPKSMSFQLLAKTVKIYNYITPSVIAEDEVINSILTLFLKKYNVLELPGYSGKLIVDDQVDRAMFENIFGALQECASRASDSSQEFEFVTTKNSCPPNITHVIHKVSTIGRGFKRIRYDLGCSMPADRKYVPDKEDFVLGALWKIFDSVYSYCFSSVLSYRTSQTLNNYFTIISNIFNSPWIIGDYHDSNGQGTFMYASRVEHENLTSLMINIDYMSEAVHLLSKLKTFFKKPVQLANSENRQKRQNKITTAATTSESPIFQNRRQKRSVSEKQDMRWDNLEIWEGRAYCLQLVNPDLSPSIVNAFPSVEDLCV